MQRNLQVGRAVRDGPSITLTYTYQGNAYTHKFRNDVEEHISMGDRTYRQFNGIVYVIGPYGDQLDAISFGDKDKKIEIQAQAPVQLMPQNTQMELPVLRQAYLVQQQQQQMAQPVQSWSMSSRWNRNEMIPAPKGVGPLHRYDPAKKDIVDDLDDVLKMWRAQ